MYATLLRNEVDAHGQEGSKAIGEALWRLEERVRSYQRAIFVWARIARRQQAYGLVLVVFTCATPRSLVTVRLGPIELGGKVGGIPIWL